MVKSPFETEHGKKIYKSAEKAISDFSMAEYLSRGVLVGLSGGADSVMLLYFLCEYRKNNFDFPIVALHLNHMIRGEDAYADEAYSQRLSAELGVEFISVYRDIPSIAADKKTGIEETARNERYLVFSEILRGRNDVGSVAVAHNATDNVETVMFNILRGSGLFGLSGISAVCENIIRPLIYCSSEDIRLALDAAGISYVTDKTNSDTNYTRNYIRHEILPKFKRIAPSPELAFTKLSSNVRAGCEYISSAAEEILLGRHVIPKNELFSVNKAVFAEIIRQMVKKHTDKMLESVHIDAIYSHVGEDNFSISLPGGVSFICERGFCTISENVSAEAFRFDIGLGENDFSDYSAKLFVDFENNKKTYSNVYNFSIQVSIPSDIIKGGLYIRSRNEGDTYRTSGMTKKVKRMFCDADIPKSLRNKIPILCDDEGILWIPGFRVRDYDKSMGGKMLYFTFVLTDLDRSDRFYFADGGAIYENV